MSEYSFDSIFQDIGDMASTAFDYISDHEWAANLVAGAAGAAGDYYAQKDQQRHDRRMMEENKKLNMTQAGSMDMNQYSSNLTSNGVLTNGLLARKKVQA